MVQRLQQQGMPTQDISGIEAAQVGSLVRLAAVLPGWLAHAVTLEGLHGFIDPTRGQLMQATHWG